VTTGADPVRLFAAGSLRAALTEIAGLFEAGTGAAVAARFGPSGLLRRAIEAGAEADVFAAADMDHPRAVAAILGGGVRAFATNTLCALVHPGLEVSPATLLERMLDPGLRLGMSTPGADPSGDYALELFGKAEALHPGAAAALEHKALRLTGGAETPPGEGSVYAAILEAGRADIFITYRTNGLAARRALASLEIVDTPPALTVRAEYGLAWRSGGGAALAHRILSTSGQAVLARHGFAPASIIFGAQGQSCRP
jgi:ABC-type molybdate transport system substrate-binding protein